MISLSNVFFFLLSFSFRVRGLRFGQIDGGRMVYHWQLFTHGVDTISAINLQL